jgi:hypothetical protein
VIDDERIRQLKELCEQADALRVAADKLCKELSEQLDRSLERHPPSKPDPERRRTPRHR